MNGRPWLPEHTTTLRMLNAVGCSDEIIAKQTGHCRETITRRRLALGLPPSYAMRYGNWMEIKDRLLTSKITSR